MSTSRFDIGDWNDEAALTDGVLVRRFFAFLIDAALISILWAVGFVVLSIFGILTLGLGLPLLGLIPLIPFAYNWLSLLGRVSATPGQALLGLRVRRDADLGPPTGLQALVWSIGFAVTCSLGFFLFAIALVTIRHRALHDIVADLVVVRARATSPLTGAASAWKTGGGGPAFE